MSDYIPVTSDYCSGFFFPQIKKKKNDRTKISFEMKYLSLKMVTKLPPCDLN